jgi:lysozyme family protein
MSAVFTATMAKTSLAEGGYVNDAIDKGGETNHGITIAVARAFGYRGEMRDLTYQQALGIYEQRYFIQPGFALIEPVSAEVAGWLLDAGINMGPATAAKMLQRALNVLNDGGMLYPDLTADGQAGAMTRNALRLFIGKRGSAGTARLVRLLSALQAARYVEIAEASPSQERFAYGWVTRALG